MAVLLLSFDNFVLQRIVDYLRFKDLKQLYFCGSQLLNEKLIHQDVVRDMCICANETFPSWLSQLSHLKSLELGGQHAPILPLTTYEHYYCLPNTNHLLKLEITIGSVNDWLILRNATCCEFPILDYFCFHNTLPIKTSKSRAINYQIQRMLQTMAVMLKKMSSLTRLQINQFWLSKEILQSLSSSLRHFESTGVKFYDYLPLQEQFALLPRTLQELTMSPLENVDEMSVNEYCDALKNLPTKLERLNCPDLWKYLWDAREFDCLPKTLKSAVISPTLPEKHMEKTLITFSALETLVLVDLRFENTPDNMNLPSTLTHLSCDNVSSKEFYSCLTRSQLPKLKNLSLINPPLECVLSETFFTSKFVIQLINFSLSLSEIIEHPILRNTWVWAMKSLTDLKLDHVNLERRFLEHLPSSLTYLSLCPCNQTSKHLLDNLNKNPQCLRNLVVLKVKLCSLQSNLISKSWIHSLDKFRGSKNFTCIFNSPECAHGSRRWHDRSAATAAVKHLFARFLSFNQRNKQEALNESDDEEQEEDEDKDEDEDEDEEDDKSNEEFANQEDYENEEKSSTPSEYRQRVRFNENKEYVPISDKQYFSDDSTEE